MGDFVLSRRVVVKFELRDWVGVLLGFDRSLLMRLAGVCCAQIELAVLSSRFNSLVTRLYADRAADIYWLGESVEGVILDLYLAYLTSGK